MIQIVINRDDVQGYAAKTVFEVRVVLTAHCLTLFKRPLFPVKSAKDCQLQSVQVSFKQNQMQELTQKLFCVHIVDPVASFSGECSLTSLHAHTTHTRILGDCRHCKRRRVTRTW